MRTGTGMPVDEEERSTEMKKFGFASVIAAGMATAVLGLAGPAQADVAHNDWVHQNGQNATAPQVDTTVHQSH